MPGYLYVHVPFCVRKCPYCDFVSAPYDGALAGQYMRALRQEIGMRADEIDGPLEGVYVGGGTPTVLTADELERLFQTIDGVGGISDGTEVTVEANPGTVDAEKFTALVPLGVNRLSIGVQSFDDSVLMALGRAHSADEARAAYIAAENAGYDNISLDLIFGVPGQTLESWRRTIRKAIDLGAAHLSAYELTLEEGTPLSRSVQGGKTLMPGGELAGEMYELAEGLLTRAGYGHYEVSNYALPGRECRHNMNYWRRGTYIGAGAAAHSFDGRIRSANIPDINGYIDAVRGGGGASSASNTEELTKEDEFTEALMLGLRTAEGVGVEDIRNIFGVDLPALCGGLKEDGLVGFSGGRMRLSPRGLRVANSLTAEILRLSGS